MESCNKGVNTLKYHLIEKSIGLKDLVVQSKLFSIGLWGIAIFVLLIVNLIPECKSKIDNSDLAKKTSKKYLIISLTMTAVGILVFIFFKSKIQEYSGLFLLSKEKLSK